MNLSFEWDKGRKQGLIECDVLESVREHFSIEDKAAKIKKYYSHFAPSRLYAITPNGRFDIGLFSEIYNYILTLQLPIKLNISDEFKRKFKPSYSFKDAELAVLNKELRPYQEKSVRKCLSQGSGNIVLGTAGGKTLIIATLVQTIRDNSDKNLTLIIVPSIQLVEQTYEDFISYGVDKNTMTMWSGDHDRDDSAEIIIASTSILQSKKQDISFLKYVDLLVIDEAHKLRKGNKINKLVKSIPTLHKFGFTGTMPDDKIDYWNIIGKIGPVLFEMSSDELRKGKFISDAKVKVLKMQYKNKFMYTETPSITNPTVMWEEENNFVAENSFRNGVISKLCNKVDKNTLIIVDRIAHGETLTEEIKKHALKKEVYFIRGSVAVEEREKIKALMEKNDNIICVAISKIFSTGINIKNLHYIIFAAAGKAKIKIIQSIGRGLRLHENKNQLIIFDIADDLIYGMRHLTKRLKLYDKENLDYEITPIKEKGN